MPCQTDRFKVAFVVFWVTTCPVFYFGRAFKAVKHHYISMSSSPELWATGKLYKGECVSAGRQEGLSGLWGVGDGQGVEGCRGPVCCLRCFCNESFSLRQKGSSGGRHNTNSMQDWLTDWATVWGRMSLMPCCRPSFKLSEITSTGRLGAGSTSRSSSSSSSSVILCSISWSFLWAASISMQELSSLVSGRQGLGCCGKVSSWGAGQGCGSGGLACCLDRGAQLFAVDQSWWGLAVEFSEISTSASSINLLLLAMHPSSSTLLLCFLRHRVSQLLESVALCKWPDVLVGSSSNSGRLVGPENEYMAGRNPSSLLEGADWCMVVQLMKWSGEPLGQITAQQCCPCIFICGCWCFDSFPPFGSCCFPLK